MKTKLKTLYRNKQKTEVEKLLENKNFRNNQNYIINYKTVKKIYFSLNLKNKDNNFGIQLLFIILYLIGFFVTTLLGGFFLNFNLYFISFLLIIFYLIVFPIYLGIKGYGDYIYYFKQNKYLIFKKSPYNGFSKYRELYLAGGINEKKYINQELIVIKK